MHWENFKKRNKKTNYNNKKINTQMKHFIILTLTAMIFASCGGTDESNLEKLVAKKDSLKEVKDELSLSIVELETQIKALDTTKSLSLVTSEMARIEKFEHFFQVYGTIQSDQNVQVYSEVSGKILDIKVEEGQNVQKGQVLAIVDVSVMREQEKELKTRLELAETTYKKQKKLWDQNIGSEIQYLQAKNNRDALKNNLATLQTQIAMGNIKAPFSGIVDETFLNPGEMAMPGLPVLRLVNLSKVYIKADVSENYIGRVKKGDKIVVSLPSMNVSVESTIDRTGQYINEANRTFKIKTTISNENNLLKPNMVALLEIEDFSVDSAVVIPSSLLLQGAGGVQYVYVINTNNGVSTVTKTVVEVGMTYQESTLITSGLNGTETLVNKGARSIRDGEQVEIKQ